MGARHTWPMSLACLVNATILPIPHPSAIFWGKERTVVHNLAWGKSTGKLDRQGGRAIDMYSEEAITSLQKAIGGTTLKVGEHSRSALIGIVGLDIRLACKTFLPSAPEWGPDATVLLSTLLDDKGNHKGVLAQLLHNLPLAGIDGLARKKLGRQTKSVGNQQPSANDNEHQVDAKQTQLFQRFAELVPNGLAILDSDAEAVFVNDGFFALTTNKTSKDFRAWPQSIDPVDYERVMTAYRKAFSSRQELRVEFRCAGEVSTEEREWRLFLLRPLSEDPEAGFICAVVDITEIKQAQLTQEKAAIEARDRKEQQERFIDMV
jgi:PAS domain-containing protein